MRARKPGDTRADRPTCMSVGKDSEGYIVNTFNLESSPELSVISSIGFSNISHPADVPSRSVTAYPLSDLHQALTATLAKLFPASFRRFFGRYVFWPFVSGITSAFTQEIFRWRRFRSLL